MQPGTEEHVTRVRKKTVPRPKPRPAPADLHSPTLYVNRELSLLGFQWRVLKEAQNPANPLLERLKFLSILGSNLDEFFMVRVAVLKQQVAAGVKDSGPDGTLPADQLVLIRDEVTRLIAAAYACLHDTLIPLLKDAGLEIIKYDDLSKAQRARLESYFHDSVFPALTPLGFDPGRPFPHISNLSLNIAAVVRDSKKVEHFARVKVPETIPKLVSAEPVDNADNTSLDFVWLEQLIASNLNQLFPGMKILEAHPFRVTRDAEVVIQELESDDLLETIEEAVWRRRFRAVVRLQVNENIPAHILDILTENLEMDPKDVYRLPGSLDFSGLRYWMNVNRPELKDPPFNPRTPAPLALRSGEDIFAAIREQDVLLHHPFESFQPVVEFLRRAARDPDVLAIKATLYRVGRNSPIVEALLEAVENGKEVAVVVELKARFDEESNIEWARTLEREGVHVVYGLLGLKVHCKVALVVRKEGETIRRYVHLGTGNYNPVTARLYTDLSLFTADEFIGADATDLFNFLTGHSAKSDYHALLVAPVNMRTRVVALIRREIEHQRKGETGHLIFKMNALEDPEMMRLLYEASRAGVRVDLLVRGTCCLRPGIPGVSENIRVISIVGRFLEHSRIYYFRNGGEEDVYAGSADLMPRNLDHRVEVLFPVRNPRLVRRLKDDVLDKYLEDDVKARVMRADGAYEYKTPDGPSANFDAQAWLLAQTGQKS